MTYYESAEDLMIGRERAMIELDRHGICDEDRAQFFADMGDHDEYGAQEVLGWLGY